MKYLIAIAIFLGCFTAAGAQHTVSADMFEKGLRQPAVQLLDVRTAKEFKTGHLPNALQADFTNKKEFAERVKSLDKDKPVFVYCLVGGRSNGAAKWLTANGFTDVTDLSGGINAWRAEGKAVTGAQKGPQMSQDLYKQAIASSQWILVDVGAEWCPPCRKMAPVVKQFAEEKKIKVLNVDGGNDLDVMKANNVTEIPTFILYKDGKEVWRKSGIVEAEAFRKAMK
ncbi:rhodanese-like domain-containing protein [Chitinophaga sp.]|uniref:rhodanese-like domain-containing protein n=1 Tax=Chitinophaga sp. TaxID=1869181 RepID=UPI00261FD9F0|nr:rhodanese-like domain-containing protein [uncultured Chitinophaga sp.]